MESAELEVFNKVPFLCWAKDRDGVHLFVNNVMQDLAGEDPTGKTDHDLVWADDADELQAHDRKVFESGKTEYLHEHVQQSHHGEATLNVVKWAGELDGVPCTFGISFVIDD